MMKVLLLGNGFDLYHFFPTRYDNFLHTVDFLIQHFNEDTMKTIGDIFGDAGLLENDSFIPLCYKEHKEAYDEVDLNIANIKKIIELAQDNIWFKYFLSSYNKELGWIDFEKEIARVLNVFDEFFCLCDDAPSFDYPNERSNAYILKCFDFFVSYYNSSIMGVEAYIPSGYCISNEFMLEDPIGSKNMVLNKQKIISKLNKELIEIAETLRLYLSDFVDAPIESIITKGLITYNTVFNDLNTIISFNYTNSAPLLYGCYDIKFIHGNTKKEIILGVNPDENDEESFQNSVDTSFIQFKKYFQRVFYRTDLEYIKFIKFQKDIFKNASKIDLLVAGHSLDVTDEDIIREIFALSRKITIVCYSDESISDSINNLVKIYGKEKFDELRYNKDLEFKLYTDFDTR